MDPGHWGREVEASWLDMEVSAGNHRGKWWGLTGQAMFHDRKTSNGPFLMDSFSSETLQKIPEKDFPSINGWI